MQATLTWLDLTASDRDKMRRVLDLFKEQGTLDEMGLGSLRDVLSDALFPGTSSIQTRLRYVLFIPWLYRRLEDRRVRAGEVQQAARRAEILELARRFSLHVYGMPLLYNLVVAERRREVLDSDQAESIDEFRAALAEWADREANEERPFEPDALWELVVRSGGRLPYPQRVFIESWSRRIAELGPDKVADDNRLRMLIAERELSLKGVRARLRNQNRLLDWTPGAGVGRMDFRWFRVRQFLIDLHRGLAA